MTTADEMELPVFREIEQLLKENRDTLLTDVVPSNCNCANAQTKRVFRCPGAFKLSLLLDKLQQMRLMNYK